MKNLFLIIAFCLAISGVAQAGNVTTYPNVGTVTGSDVFFDWQSGAQQNATGAQLKNFIVGQGSVVVANGKTFTVNNTLTATATDGSTITFGSGGTVLYTSAIGSSVQAFNSNLSQLSGLATPSGTYVLSMNPSGTMSWIAQSGAGAITIGSNATGYLSFSSSVLDFTHGVNVAQGPVFLDSSGSIVAGLLSNYIGSTVQGYNSETTILGNVVTGTGSLVRSTSPTLSGTVTVSLLQGVGATLPIHVWPTTGNVSIGYGSDPGDPLSVNGTIRQGVTNSPLMANGNGEIVAAVTTGTGTAVLSNGPTINNLELTGTQTGLNATGAWSASGIYSNGSSLYLSNDLLDQSLNSFEGLFNGTGATFNIAEGQAQGEFEVYFLFAGDGGISTSGQVVATTGLQVLGGATSVDGGLAFTDGNGNLTCDSYFGIGDNLTVEGYGLNSLFFAGTESLYLGTITTPAVLFTTGTTIADINGTTTVAVATDGDASNCSVSGNLLSGLFDGTGNPNVNIITTESVSISGISLNGFYGSGGAVNCPGSDGSTSGIAAFQGDGSLAQATGSQMASALGLTTLSGSLTAGSSTQTVPAGIHPWVQNTNTSALTNVGEMTVSVSGTTATIKSSNVLDTSTYTLFYGNF